MGSLTLQRIQRKKKVIRHSHESIFLHLIQGMVKGGDASSMLQNDKPFWAAMHPNYVPIQDITLAQILSSPLQGQQSYLLVCLRLSCYQKQQ